MTGRNRQCPDSHAHAPVPAQNRAVVNLFRGPNMIEDVAVTMRRLEQGDLKLRVRALDSERALTRVLVGLLTLGAAKASLAGGHKCMPLSWQRDLSLHPVGAVRVLVAAGCSLHCPSA